MKSQTPISFTSCYICGQNNYCIEASWAEDYDEDGHPMTVVEPTCLKCLDDVHEDLAVELNDFIQEHVYSEPEISNKTKSVLS